MKNDELSLLFFPNETFYLACFYAFLHFYNTQIKCIFLAGTQSTFLKFFICSLFSEFDSNLVRSGFPAGIPLYF